MLDAVATQSSEPVDGVAELKRKIEMVGNEEGCD